MKTGGPAFFFSRFAIFFMVLDKPKLALSFFFVFGSFFFGGFFDFLVTGAITARPVILPTFTAFFPALPVSFPAPTTALAESLPVANATCSSES